MQRTATKIVIRVRDYRGVRHSGKREKKKGNKKKIGGEKSGTRNHNHTDRRLRDVVSKRRFREARGVRGNSHWGAGMQIVDGVAGISRRDVLV